MGPLASHGVTYPPTSTVQGQSSGLDSSKARLLTRERQATRPVKDNLRSPKYSHAAWPQPCRAAPEGTVLASPPPSVSSTRSSRRPPRQQRTLRALAASSPRRPRTPASWFGLAVSVARLLHLHTHHTIHMVLRVGCPLAMPRVGRPLTTSPFELAPRSRCTSPSPRRLCVRARSAGHDLAASPSAPATHVRRAPGRAILAYRELQAVLRLHTDSFCRGWSRRVAPHLASPSRR
jgi:hypothetical protein